MIKKILYTLKKLLFFLFVAAIVLLCAYSVRLMYQADDKYTVQIPAAAIQTAQYSEDDLYPVRKGDLRVMMQISGTVAPASDGAFTDIPIDTNVNGIKVRAEQGHLLQKDEPYADVWGRPHAVESPMRCHSINWREDGCTIRFLDYRKLYAEAQIPQEYLSYDLFSCDFTAKTDTLSLPVTLDFEDSFVNGGNVKAHFKFSELCAELLPGTELTIETELETKKDVLLVPAEYIIAVDDKYSVQTTADMRNVQVKEIELGAVTDNIAEIKDGLSEGEMLVLPSGAMSLAAQMEKDA